MINFLKFYGDQEVIKKAGPDIKISLIIFIVFLVIIAIILFIYKKNKIKF